MDKNNTGGTKYDEGKLEWDMIPFDILEGLVKIYMMGRDKYTKNNWKKGIATTRLFNAAMRHMIASFNGEDLDPESGLPHNTHAIWNLIAMEWMRKNKPEMDDRPHTVKILVPRDSNIDFASLGITEQDIIDCEKQMEKICCEPKEHMVVDYNNDGKPMDSQSTGYFSNGTFDDRYKVKTLENIKKEK